MQWHSGVLGRAMAIMMGRATLIGAKVKFHRALIEADLLCVYFDDKDVLCVVFMLSRGRS